MKEKYVSGAYHNQSGCRTYMTEDELYPCTYMSTFEQRLPYVENMNYDLTRLSRDWRPDQVHPDLLAPKLKSWRRLRYPDRQSYPQTMYPRSTINNCDEYAFAPGCTKEGFGNKYQMTDNDDDNDYDDSVAFAYKERRYFLPGIEYDPPGYDDYRLNPC